MPTPNALLAGALSTLALLGASPAAQAAEPDLLAHWPLDTIGTTTPNTVDTRLIGTSVTGTAVVGQYGSALSLVNTPGTQGFFADDTAKLVEPTSVTVMAWVKRDSAPTWWAPILAKSGFGAGPYECELSAFALMSGGDEGAHFAITTPGEVPGNLSIASSESIPAEQVWDGKWHAVAGIFDASARTLSIALDGKVVSTKTVEGASIAYGSFPQRSLAVGRYPVSSCDGPGRGLEGAVDDVRVYGRALGAAELAFLQDRTATAPPALPIVKPSPDLPISPEQQQPAPSSSAPLPVPALPPLRIPPLPPGSVIFGSTPKPGQPLLPKPPLQLALKKAVKPMNDLLEAPKPTSHVVKESPKLTKKERSKLKPSKSLDELLDQLLLGLPVRLKVTGNAQYAEVVAALTIRRRTPAGKIEINTVALPPVVLPVKDGLAIGRLTIDPVAAKVLRKSGAIDAAVGIISVAIDRLPNAKPAEKASIDEKLAKQLELEKQLGQQIQKLKEADKTVDKVTSLADKAKGEADQKQADAKQDEAEKKRDEARDGAASTADDLLDLQRQAIEEMTRQIIEFLRQLAEQQTLVIQKITRV